MLPWHASHARSQLAVLFPPNLECSILRSCASARALAPGELELTSQTNAKKIASSCVAHRIGAEPSPRSTRYAFSGLVIPNDVVQRHRSVISAGVDRWLGLDRVARK